MSRSEIPRAALANAALPVQSKLAAAWASFMFLYIYVDDLHLYKPDAIDDILAGEAWLYFYDLGLAIELIVLAAILRLAWTWPRSAAAGPERPNTRAAQLR